MLFMERLSRWIHCEVERGRWKLLSASKGGPPVSHLLFAVDMLLFVEAAEEQVECILNGINKFCNASGQRINFSKSLVMFSSNLPSNETLKVSTGLGIKEVKELGTYLGHHLHHQGRSDRANSKLLEKVRGRLDG